MQLIATPSIRLFMTMSPLIPSPCLAHMDNIGGYGGEIIVISTKYTDEAKGKELRKRIDDIYSSLPTRPKRFVVAPTVGADHDRTDISWLISEYIPNGTSLDVAEHILASAGFTIAEHKPNPHISEKYAEKYTTFAEIDQVTENPTARMRIFVQLVPAKPGGYGVVGSLSAGIYKQAM